MVIMPSWKYKNLPSSVRNFVFAPSVVIVSLFASESRLFLYQDAPAGISVSQLLVSFLNVRRLVKTLRYRSTFCVALLTQTAKNRVKPFARSTMFLLTGGTLF